jgi:hypothetical protein
MPIVAALMLAYGVYTLDDRNRNERLHPSYARRVGFSARVFDARDCNSKEELADLIIASSATPPFTSVGNFRGERLLDGGIIDPAPAFVANEVQSISRNLVMLTKPCPPELIGRQDGRLYIAPREPLAVRSWDFAQPELLEETIATGERDAERNESLLDVFLQVERTSVCS